MLWNRFPCVLILKNKTQNTKYSDCSHFRMVYFQQTNPYEMEYCIDGDGDGSGGDGGVSDSNGSVSNSNNIHTIEVI